MNLTSEDLATDRLVAQLRRPEAYPHPVDGPVVVHETHISVVFLAGEFAYKIKKPIKTGFLDYRTLDQRRRYCEEEFRLDRRYADELYLGVVPIQSDGENVKIQGQGEAVEYAVKMRRFPSGVLLSERIDAGKITRAHVFQLADTVAGFHRQAAVSREGIASQWPDFLVKNVHQIIETLLANGDAKTAATLTQLHAWSNDYFERHLQTLTSRVEAGFIRECHGDLHLANVIDWQGRLLPFDGIEFNDRLRWIDVLSDAAFLAMDFAAHDRADLSRSFLNAYLEHTGDYGSPQLLRMFLFYRALVRALAASMRHDADDRRRHIQLAYRYTLRETPCLWITHGVSGSGKTTLSETLVQRHGAIRVRSDIERKRIFGLRPTERPPASLRSEMYGPAASAQTYRRLQQLARGILRSGCGVIVDAAFLKRFDRDRFRGLAEQEGVPFAILDCDGDVQTMRQRIADRMETDTDASDADLDVLEHQLANRDPLSVDERRYIDGSITHRPAARSLPSAGKRAP